MKLCKDCKYYEPTLAGVFYAGCTAPQSAKLNLVNGEQDSVRAIFSRENRGYISNPCSPEAKHFQPKETLWHKVAKLLTTKSTASRSNS